jgi:hypothetical protein
MFAVITKRIANRITSGDLITVQTPVAISMLIVRMNSHILFFFVMPDFMVLLY